MKEIADFFKVDYATVAYHLNKRQRRNTLERARKALENNGKKPKTEEKKKYDVAYYKDRYHNDSEFRMKVIRANSGGKFKEGED